MKRKINGQLGDWKVNTAIARPIEINIKCTCLELFKQGSWYRMAANALRLKLYTVRDWARRFKLGDESWAHRDGRKFHHCNEAAELIKYRDENETFISSSGSFASRNESCDSSKQSFGGRESQMVGSTEYVERLTGEVNNRLKKATTELVSIILCNGTKVNHKRIYRLMKEHGIHSRIRRRKHPDNYYKEVKEKLKKNKVPNILKRDFISARPLYPLV
jgi:transposase